MSASSLTLGLVESQRLRRRDTLKLGSRASRIRIGPVRRSHPASSRTIGVVEGLDHDAARIAAQIAALRRGARIFGVFLREVGRRTIAGFAFRLRGEILGFLLGRRLVRVGRIGLTAIRMCAAWRCSSCVYCFMLAAYCAFTSSALPRSARQRIRGALRTRISLLPAC
jgi:hypothetical protein